MLIRGSSNRSIRTNIAQKTARRGAKSSPQAVAIAYRTAREAWREGHPKGPFPKRLRAPPKKG